MFDQISGHPMAQSIWHIKVTSHLETFSWKAWSGDKWIFTLGLVFKNIMQAVVLFCDISICIYLYIFVCFPESLVDYADSLDYNYKWYFRVLLIQIINTRWTEAYLILIRKTTLSTSYNLSCNSKRAAYSKPKNTITLIICLHLIYFKFLCTSNLCYLIYIRRLHTGTLIYTFKL